VSAVETATQQQPPTRYADAGAGAAGPSSQSTALFPIIGTNGLHAAIAPRSAASVMSSSLLKQQQQRSGMVGHSTAAAAAVTPIRAADLFAEAAAAKRF
jgi:hypothetical protein